MRETSQMLEEDEAVLREKAKSCKNPNEKVRYFALHFLSIDKTISEAAKAFMVDRSTVYDWIQEWKHEKSLGDKPKEGRPPSFGEKEKKELKALVEENDPSKHGFNATMWDTKSLQLYFESKSIMVSRETIRRTLLKMGGHYVKAVHEYTEADKRKQLIFARKTLRTLESVDKDTVVLFEDEMSAGGSMRKGYGWTFGERLVVKAPAYHMQRSNVFGAVSPLTGDIVQSSSRSAKTPAFMRFLKKTIDRFPGKRIILFMDNFRVHSSRKIRDFLKRHPNVKVVFTPPYSPRLNPQEYWWNYLRRKLLNNRFFRSARQMALALARFVKSVSKEIIMSVCSLNPLRKILKDGV